MYELHKERIINECSELEYNLHQFLESNEKHSLKRWLLTRTNDELDTLSEISDKFSNEMDGEDEVFLMPMIIMINDGIESFDNGTLLKITNEVCTSIALIDLVKKGLVKYKMADDDDDWIFSIPSHLRDGLKKELNIKS